MIDAEAVFRKVQTARPAQRKAILDKAFAGNGNPLELHHRALLMTRMRLEGLWPPRGATVSAFDEEDDCA